MKLFNKNIFFLLIFLFIFTSCGKPDYYKWVFTKNIDLGKKTGPIGVIAEGDFLWVSDSDKKRILKTDLEGNILETFEDFERPMHLAIADDVFYIPQYSSDTIATLNKNGERSFLKISQKTDAPAGIDVSGNTYAIADFYNHRIIFNQNGKDKTFGKKGHNSGELHYPTDVQLVGDLIYVADAYNNKIQVFDYGGKSVQTIGKSEKMNATTGVFVSENQVFATDFENNRLHIYDLSGNLVQSIFENLNKPTDVFVKNDKMYVTNYKGHSIGVFTWTKVPYPGKGEIDGKEYLSDYICPMHCKGSGANKAGKCPVCGMDYVKNN